MGVAPLAPLAAPPAGDAASASGSSTPRSVSFAVEPPRYSVEREGGRRVERKKKKKTRRDGGDGDGEGRDEESGGWMSWFLDVSSGLPPSGSVVSGRFDERMGGRGPGGGGAFDFGL